MTFCKALFGALSVLATMLLAAPALPPPASSAAVPVPADWFGLHVNNASPNPPFRLPQTPFPDIGQRAIRLWDTYTSWRHIERTKGEFDWSRLDFLVAQAERHGCEVYLVLGQTPDWAAARATGGSYITSPPRDLSDWRNYVAAVAGRYGNRIRYYELWNEPDVGGWQGSPAQLVELAAAAYPIIKAAAPKSLVVSPSFQAQTVYLSPGRLSLARYLAAGGARWADAFAVHAYAGDGFAPEVLPPLLKQFRTTLDGAGAGQKPLIDSESGVRGWRDRAGKLRNIAPTRFGEPLPSEEAQAAYLTRQLLAVASAGVVRQSYYFTYDNANGRAGTRAVMAIGMVDYPTQPSRQLRAAFAYRYLAGLLSGGRITPERTEAGTTSVDIRSGDGRAVRVYWRQAGTVTLPLKPGEEARDNVGAPLPSGKAVSVGLSPVFVFREALAPS